MFSDPQRNIDQFMLGEGMHVADLGAGSGAYTRAAASVVGKSGRIYAVDVQKDLAARVKNAAAAEGFSNVEALWGDIENLHGTKLGDASCDAAIISNVLFQTEDKNGLARESFRIIRSGGKALVVDWADSFANTGPREDDVISKIAARGLFEAAGFYFERDIDAGAHHWGFVLRKK